MLVLAGAARSYTLVGPTWVEGEIDPLAAFARALSDAGRIRGPLERPGETWPSLLDNLAAGLWVIAVLVIAVWLNR